jgi:hypothetical protein
MDARSTNFRVLVFEDLLRLHCSTKPCFSVLLSNNNHKLLALDPLSSNLLFSSNGSDFTVVQLKLFKLLVEAEATDLGKHTLVTTLPESLPDMLEGPGLAHG